MKVKIISDGTPTGTWLEDHNGAAIRGLEVANVMIRPHTPVVAMKEWLARNEGRVADATEKSQ